MMMTPMTLGFLVALGYLMICPQSVLGEPPCAPQFVMEWGQAGSGDGEFGWPRGIACGAAGVVYVGDFDTHRVQRFSDDGAYLSQWGAEGSAPGQFSFPMGIDVALGVVDTVYVGDWLNRRVQKFTGTGEFLLAWGSYGLDPGQFISVSDVAVDADGYVYVTDFDWSRVQKFTADGDYVTEWGEYGTGDGEFEAADAIDVRDGLVVVSDYSNRIQTFDTQGTLIDVWGSTGTLPGQFGRAAGVALAPGSSWGYFVDQNNHRVQRMEVDGTFMCLWGGLGSGEGQFSAPRYVCVSPDGNDIFVTDAANHRVQKFSYNIASAVRPAPARLALTSHPNPFNATTTIQFGGAGDNVRVEVYDIRGRLVRTLVDGARGVRDGVVTWDGRTNRGVQATAGVYFVRLTSGAGETTRRIVLLR